MLYRTLFRRALTLQLTHHTFRCFASTTMSYPPTATPIQKVHLDRSIFNQTLFQQVRDFWFSELPTNAVSQNDASINKWYGRDLSSEQREQQDEECRRLFGHALGAVGPEKVALPEFVSGEVDVQQAGTLSKPFLEEVESAQREGGEEVGSLKKVFTHYDRLAHSLVHSSLALSPSPILHSSHRLRPVIRQWFLMPLMHSEYLPSHHIFSQLVQEAKQHGEQEGVEDAVSHCDNALSFEKMHIEPLERFGRYPHRNEALGRESTGEEREFLGRGETFGVKQSGEKDGVKEKSEL